MALSTSFQNAVQVMFRDLKEEFEASMNPLEKVFNFASNTKRDQFIDFIEPIEVLDNGQIPNTTGANLRRTGPSTGAAATEIASGSSVAGQEELVYQLDEGGGFTDRFRRNRKTPEAVALKWKRRRTSGRGRQLRLIVPRADAQVTGRGLDTVMSKYKKKMLAWFQRETLDMMQTLITADVKEDPSIAGFNGTSNGAGKTVTFNHKYRHLLKDMGRTGSNATFTAPFDIARTFFLTAQMQDDTMASETEDSLNQSTGTNGLNKKLCILCSNRGYAGWKYHNRDEIGNKDYFGSSIILGSGRIHEFREYKFITLPDELMQGAETVSDGNLVAGSVYFPAPKHWDSYPTPLLNASRDASDHEFAGGRPVNGQFAKPNSLERALIFDPRAVMFWRPSVLGVELEHYRDKDRTMEHNFYKQFQVEAVRIWDPLVRELYFTPTDTRSGTSDQT